MRNEELIENWLEALRSGKFKQVQNKLRKDVDKQEFCCLGVLCEISGMGHWEERLNADENATMMWYVPSEDTAGAARDYLPTEVMAAVGLQDTEGKVSTDNPKVAALLAKIREEDEDHTYVRVTSLAQLNDKGATFEEIADIIESGAPFEWSKEGYSR